MENASDAIHAAGKPEQVNATAEEVVGDGGVGCESGRGSQTCSAMFHPSKSRF